MYITRSRSALLILDEKVSQTPGVCPSIRVRLRARRSTVRLNRRSQLSPLAYWMAH